MSTKITSEIQRQIDTNIALSCILRLYSEIWGGEYIPKDCLASVREFNSRVNKLFPEMAKRIEDGMVRLNETERELYNYQGSPYINEVTGELTWWVEKDIYDSLQELKPILGQKT